MHNQQTVGENASTLTGDIAEANCQNDILAYFVK